MSPERRNNNAGCLGGLALLAAGGILLGSWIEAHTGRIAVDSAGCGVKEGVSGEFWAGNRRFPVEGVNTALEYYCAAEAAEAKEHGVPLNIGEAVKLIETDVEYGSEADKARSRCGAIGASQIIPSDIPYGICGIQNTALFSDRPTTRELMDPQTNIHWKYALLKQYHDALGSWEKAIALYGPTDDGEYLSLVKTVRRYLK